MLDELWAAEQQASPDATGGPAPTSPASPVAATPATRDSGIGTRDSPSPDRRALYLRWRPGRFADVLGQDHVTRTLRHAVLAGQVAHAYLFCGPRGTGKTSIARILFKALACTAPQDGDACGTCAACRDVTTGRALDLVEIDAASNRGIDHIRDLREKVWIAPSQAPRKMYILDEAHQLSAAAWDAFLKTLEEPPAHVVFVLATTEVHKVPATILSRCQRFDLGRIALTDLVTHLGHVIAAEHLTAEPAVLQRVARLARGSVRDALSTLDQLVAYAGMRLTLAAAREVLGLSSEESLRTTAEALARHDARAALEVVAALAREGADIRQFLDDLVAYMRALLVARLGASDVLAFEFGADEQAWLESQAGAWQPARLVELVRQLSTVETRGRDAGQLQVHLELALLQGTLDGAPERAVAASSRPAPVRAHPIAPAERERAPHADASGPADPAGAKLAQPPPTIPDQARKPTSPESAPTHTPAETSGQPEPAGRLPESGASAQFGAPQPAAGGQPPDVAMIRQLWPQFVEAVFAQRRPAGIALEAARVEAFEAGELRLAFPHEFLQRTIEETECRRAIEQLLADELQLDCRIRCALADSRQPALFEDTFLQQAVDLFRATGVERVDAALATGGEHQP